MVSEDIKDKEVEEENTNYIKLDYKLETPQERNELVKKIIAQTPPERLTPRYLEILSDYIIFAMNKEEKKQKIVLTDNRMKTVNKRETSYQGLTEKLENGEDGIYGMIANDKNIIFTPKVSITEQDLAEMPELRELRAAIDEVERQMKAATGKRKFALKTQLIEMRQDQYVIKNSYKQPFYCMNAIKSFSKVNLSESYYIDEKGNPQSTGLVSFFNPKHISALLCNYAAIKEEAWGKFSSDSYYMMEDLDDLVDLTLKEEYPLYYDLVIYKIDGKQNIEIQALLEERHGIKHSVEYISSLWRNKIPKLIARKAEEEYLKYHYTIVEKGYWKKCNRCGEIKLGHNYFFSKNKGSKDGWYSICKCCRNKKK